MALWQQLRRVVYATTPLVRVALIAWLLGATAYGQQPIEQVDVAIIVHADNELTALTLDQARALFNLKKRFWSNGKSVQVILPSREVPERAVLLDKVYGLSAEQLAAKWRQRIFAGEIITVPTGAPSREFLLHAVESNIGAISAVSASAVSGKVRVIRLDGKLPGESGYPLR